MREIAASESSYSDFHYLVELIDHLRACGFEGRVFQVLKDPTVLLPDMRGLHFVIRSSKFVRTCYSGHWRGLDSMLGRELMRKIVYSKALLIFALQTLEPYHSITMKAEGAPYAEALRRALALEQQPNLLLFLGRQFLFDEINEDSGPQFSLDLLEIINWELPEGTTLALMELISRSRKTELLWPPVLENQNGISSTKIGMLEIRSDMPSRRPRAVRRLDIKNVLSSLAGIRLDAASRRQLLSLLEGYLHEKDFAELSLAITEGCSRFLQ